MKFPIHHIATLAVALHTALGCCFHHAHACEVNCCETPAPLAAACACDGHGHDDQQQSETPQHDNHGKHQCQSDACVFAKTERSANELDDAVYPSFAISVVGIAHQPQVTDGQTAAATHTRFAAERAPVRAHLLFQVLLI